MPCNSGSGRVLIELEGGRLQLEWNRRRLKFRLTRRGDQAFLAAHYMGTSLAEDSAPPVKVRIRIGPIDARFDLSLRIRASAFNDDGKQPDSRVSVHGASSGAGLKTEDLDGDGHAADVDCADRDPEIHPGAAGGLLDGVDQDCDGRDSKITQVVDEFAPSAGYESLSVSWLHGDLPDFTGWDKRFTLTGMAFGSFYQINAISWVKRDATSDQIGRGRSYFGRWARFHATGGETIDLTLTPGYTVTEPGTHPAFVLFWRPEGDALSWQIPPYRPEETLDPIPGIWIPQLADWTITGLPPNAAHRPTPDKALYGMTPDSYTLFHVAAGWDADPNTDSNTFAIHPTTLDSIAVRDGVPGRLATTITLPKAGYYLLWIANVQEVSSCTFPAVGLAQCTDPLPTPGRGVESAIVATITPHPIP